MSLHVNLLPLETCGRYWPSAMLTFLDSVWSPTAAIGFDRSSHPCLTQVFKIRFTPVPVFACFTQDLGCSQGWAI